MNGLIREGKLSVSSIEKVLDVLNTAYNWAVSREELASNPVLTVKNSLQKRIQKLKQKSANEADVIVLSPEEEQNFIREALIKDNTGRYKYAAGPVLVFLDQTALRCGELIALKWKDIQWESGLLTIEKSSSMVKNRRQDEGKKYVRDVGSTKRQE